MPANQPKAANHASGANLAIRAKASQKLNEEQKRFNALQAKISELKQSLADWYNKRAKFAEQYLPDYRKKRETMLVTHLRFIDTIDKYLRFPEAKRRLGRAVMDDLEECILEMLESVPDEYRNARWHELFEHYQGVSWQEAEDEAFDMMREDIMIEFGPEFLADFEGTTVDELDQFMFEKLAKSEQDDDLDEFDQASASAKRERAHASSKAKRSKAGANDQPGANHSADRSSASSDSKTNLRDIFRKLSAFLHPDREPDPQERERKTELLKEVNAAYEKADLFSLLLLEQQLLNEKSTIADAPKQKLRQYNSLLQQSVRQLQGELDQAIAKLYFEFDLRPTVARPSLLDLSKEIKASLSAYAKKVEVTDMFTKQLQIPSQRWHAMRQIAELNPDQGEDDLDLSDEEFEILLDQIGANFHSPAQRQSKKKRK